MPRRIIAAVAALVLAVVGAVVLIGYVRGADDRAQAGEQLVDVLVVDSEVAAGTSAGDLGSSVSVERVPTRLVAEDAVSDLSELGDQVATAALLPGDQVLAGRFADRTSLAPAGTVLAPEGLVEISVTLDAQRAVGGAVKPGDKVGIQLTNQESAEGGVTAYSVFQVFRDVLVTRVVRPEGSADPAAPYVVTVALSPQDASVVVLGTESESVWLSLEKASPGDAGQSPVTTTTVTLGDDQ
ncbi:Flp pilus assembly protein CpaB [Blastococcus litoris]|uniref:Flp pilus assembly protein CpaB n=1 Tax=Blastococcus litoris TaxID=2171622 RepID=UPI000E3010DA|nr:RcpC/CpaB family pilus assembly protein [Blastococcus litoris]